MAKRKKANPERILKVLNQEDAEKVIDQQYKSDIEADYIVLENAAVFCGPAIRRGLQYARKFKLKTFEVKM